MIRSGNWGGRGLEVANIRNPLLLVHHQVFDKKQILRCFLCNEILRTCCGRPLHSSCGRADRHWPTCECVSWGICRGFRWMTSRASRTANHIFPCYLVLEALRDLDLDTSLRNRQLRLSRAVEVVRFKLAF